MRKPVLGLVAAFAASALALALWVRHAPSDPASWHVDPLAAGGSGKRNAWHVAPAGSPPADAVAPAYRLPPTELASLLDARVLDEPRTQRLAGAPETLWTTYIQRSRWMRFPDYISVRVVGIGARRSTLAILSRSRFGSDDMGVNRARVDRWLRFLQPVAAPAGPAG